MRFSWERAASIKNYLRMKGLERRGSALPPMFTKLNTELHKDLGLAKKEYPVDFAPEIQIRIDGIIYKRIWKEVEAALADKRERVWVILNRFENVGNTLLLTARELVTFQELQRHVGGNIKRNGTSIDSRKILFYFEHLPLDGIWTLVHSHVDGPPFPTGPDISYLPLGWLGLTASVFKGRYYIIPFRSDSFEFKGIAPSRKSFDNFVLDIKGGMHRGWFEEAVEPKHEAPAGEFEEVG